jgi:UDP-3-O-[3-hydroxymyristoyl] glucosamine N-acyltransferase
MKIKYFVKNSVNKFEKTSVIGTNENFVFGIYLGYNFVLGDNVIIGNNATILNIVVISDNVKIGSGSLVKSRSVIGEKGFASERDETNAPLPATSLRKRGHWRFCRSRCNTIACGTFNDTEIGDFVKTDD